MGRHNPKSRRTPKLRPTDSDSPPNDIFQEIPKTESNAAHFLLGERFSTYPCKTKTRESPKQDPAMFPSFLDGANSSSSNSSNPRLAPSPMANSSQQQPQVNGGGVNGAGGGMNGVGMLPMNAGAHMDVNMLYQKVLELSEQLRANREQTAGIVRGAEELAVRHPISD